MAWEFRGGRRYYYRAERIGGRVVKTYFGGGDAAWFAESCDLEARAKRASERAEATRREIERKANEEELKEIDAQIDRTLQAAGLHRPKRGRWRTKRDGRVE